MNSLYWLQFNACLNLEKVTDLCGYMVYSEQELSIIELVIPLTMACSFNFGKKAEQDEP